MPVRGHLENGARLNPDGFGWAMLAGGNLVSRRSLNGEDMISDFMTRRAASPDAPALFHARHATDTEPTVGNAHPFPLGGDTRVAVAHNGYLFPVTEGEQRSDSRIFAEEILPRYNLDDPSHVAKLEAWLGTNKVVVLSGSPAHGQAAYILNAGRGVWLGDGTWHSNPDYTGTLQDDTRCRSCGSDDLLGGLSLATGGELCKQCVTAMDYRTVTAALR
jgi:hypothetical protein